MILFCNNSLFPQVGATLLCPSLVKLSNLFQSTVSSRYQMFTVPDTGLLNPLLLRIGRHFFFPERQATVFVSGVLLAPFVRTGSLPSTRELFYGEPRGPNFFPGKKGIAPPRCLVRRGSRTRCSPKDNGFKLVTCRFSLSLVED